MDFLDKNRNALLDAVKAIAMFFVVLIHILQRTIPGFISEACWGSQIPYLLCVPVFFFFSGLSYSRKKELTVTGFFYDILKRGFLYFWPFLLFIFLRIGIYNQWSDVGQAFDQLMGYPVSGLWVCWILLWITIVMDIGLLISKANPKYKKVFVTSTLVIALLIMYVLRQTEIIQHDSFIGYNYFMTYTPVFILGYLIGDLYFTAHEKKRKAKIVLSVLSLIGLIVLCYYQRFFITTNFFPYVAYFYLASILGICVYFGVVELLKVLKKTTKVLAINGRFTLEMYFIHLIILKAFTSLFYDSWIITLLVSIGLLLLCYAAEAVIITITYHVPFLHFVIFGKHFSKYAWEDRFWKRIKDYCYSKEIKVSLRKKDAK